MTRRTFNNSIAALVACVLVVLPLSACAPVVQCVPDSIYLGCKK